MQLEFSYFRVLEPLRLGYNFFKDGIGAFFSLFTMSNLRTSYRTYKKMTYWQLFVAFLKLNFRLAFMMLTVFFHIIWWVDYESWWNVCACIAFKENRYSFRGANSVRTIFDTQLIFLLCQQGSTVQERKPHSWEKLFFSFFRAETDPIFEGVWCTLRLSVV